MPKSLLEQLPKIVADGRQWAASILKGWNGHRRIAPRAREWMLPSTERRFIAATPLTYSNR